MTKNLLEQTIFEVYGPDGFRGQAFIQKNARGKRELISARHVVFDNGKPTPVWLQDRRGHRVTLDKQTTFTFSEWKKTFDIASVPLRSKGPGLHLARRFDAHQPVRVVGSVETIPFVIRNILTVVGLISRTLIPRYKTITRESSLEFHHKGSHDVAQTFPGTSGAPIVTHDLRVLGVHTGKTHWKATTTEDGLFTDPALK